MELNLENEWAATLKKTIKERKRYNQAEVERLEAQKEAYRKSEVLRKQEALKAQLEAEEQERLERGYGEWN